MIHGANLGDASSISDLVLRTLRESNAAFYPPDVLASVMANFSAEKIAARMADRLVLIAENADAIVGTASLQKDWVRSVFVSPDRQGLGIGRRLMTRIEQVALDRRIRQLVVPSSINAENFYRKLGYLRLRDVLNDGERIIMMAKTLSVSEQG